MVFIQSKWFQRLSIFADRQVGDTRFFLSWRRRKGSLWHHNSCKSRLWFDWDKRSPVQQAWWPHGIICTFRNVKGENLAIYSGRPNVHSSIYIYSSTKTIHFITMTQVMYLRPKGTYFLSINIIWRLPHRREDECGPLRSTSVQPIHPLCCHKITEDRGQVL